MRIHKKNVKITKAQEILPMNLKNSILRTMIYTIGHITIAMLCIVFITGADIRLATIDAIVEPLINGVWYFLLEYIWSFQYSKGKLLKNEG